VEIPGIPENAFRYDVPNPGKGAAVKQAEVASEACSLELASTLHHVRDRLGELFHVSFLAELRMRQFVATRAHLHP